MLQARFPWVMSAVEDKDPEKRGMSGLDLLPDEASSEARLRELRKVEAWLAKLPFAGRPLVKVGCPKMTDLSSTLAGCIAWPPHHCQQDRKESGGLAGQAALCWATAGQGERIAAFASLKARHVRSSTLPAQHAQDGVQAGRAALCRAAAGQVCPLDLDAVCYSCSMQAAQMHTKFGAALQRAAPPLIEAWLAGLYLGGVASATCKLPLELPSRQCPLQLHTAVDYLRLPHMHCCLQGNAQVAPAEAIHLLQATLPPGQQALPPVELSSVEPALLLPPAAAAGALFEVLTGGGAEVGDR